MAQIRTRINLSARGFPLVQENWGRTVIVSGQDQNFNRQVQASTDSDHDVGIPQIFYAHNVMPHAQGFQSIGYLGIVAAATDGLVFSQIFNILDDLGNFALMGIAGTTWYFWEPSIPVWTARVTGASTAAKITVAYCSGKSYIYQKVFGAKLYDFTTKSLVNVDLTGLDITIVEGLTSSFGYLIAWSGVREPQTYSVAFTNGSDVAVSTGLGPPPPVLTNLVGQIVSAPELPLGTTVLSVSGSNINLSAAATATNPAGILSSPGIAGAVFWSSTITETDFVPSLITGAGGGAVQGLVGTIVTCTPHTKGFLIYGTGNIVAATYSGNSRYPFDAQAIVGSGGITDYSLVTVDANTSGHFAYTTSGIQNVNLGTSTVVLTDVTDFISGKLFEDWNDALQEFVQTELTATMQKRLAIIANRYVVISYGMTSLTHALVYDIITTRMGKLRIPHVQCFELYPTVLGDTEISRESMAFLQADGTIKTVDFNTRAAESNGFLLLGKYQYVRARNLILDEVWIENIYDYTKFSLTAFVSLYGKTYTSLPVLVPDPGSTNSKQGHYKDRQEGENISLCLQGQFHLESGVIGFNVGGKR